MRRSRRTATGETIATVPEGSRDDARRAIAAAERAWPGWAGRSAFDRAAAMRRVAAEIDVRREELARTLALDQGKPLEAEARDEVDELIAYFDMAAADATRAGVFDLVTGPGPVVGDEIASHPATAAVGFIGSIATGRRVAERAAGKERRRPRGRAVLDRPTG